MKFELGRDRQFDFPDQITLLTDEGHVVEISMSRPEPEQPHRSGVAKVFGFRTAAEAETIGLRLTQGIMWAAISRRVPLRLMYRTPFPATVFSRLSGGGLVFRCSAVIRVTSDFNSFVSGLRSVLAGEKSTDSRLLISMEQFTSARLEATDRTRFLGMVSAIEPIAVQGNNEGIVEELVKECRAALARLSLQFPETVRASLEGRIRDLKRESVNFAIKRLIGECLDNNSAAIQLINKAYEVRSHLLHEGTADDDLLQITFAMEELVRRIIAIKIGLSLDAT